jgi:hypothetical protein
LRFFKHFDEKEKQKSIVINEEQVIEKCAFVCSLFFITNIETFNKFIALILNISDLQFIDEEQKQFKENNEIFEYFAENFLTNTTNILAIHNPLLIEKTFDSFIPIVNELLATIPLSKKFFNLDNKEKYNDIFEVKDINKLIERTNTFIQAMKTEGQIKDQSIMDSDLDSDEEKQEEKSAIEDEEERGALSEEDPEGDQLAKKQKNNIHNIEIFIKKLDKIYKRKITKNALDSLKEEVESKKEIQRSDADKKAREDAAARLKKEIEEERIRQETLSQEKQRKEQSEKESREDQAAREILEQQQKKLTEQKTLLKEQQTLAEKQRRLAEQQRKLSEEQLRLAAEAMKSASPPKETPMGDKDMDPQLDLSDPEGTKDLENQGPEAKQKSGLIIPLIVVGGMSASTAILLVNNPKLLKQFIESRMGKYLMKYSPNLLKNYIYKLINNESGGVVQITQQQSNQLKPNQLKPNQSQYQSLETRQPKGFPVESNYSQQNSKVIESQFHYNEGLLERAN